VNIRRRGPLKPGVGIKRSNLMSGDKDETPVGAGAPDRGLEDVGRNHVTPLVRKKVMSPDLLVRYDRT